MRSPSVLESYRSSLERLARAHGIRDAEDVVQEAYVVLHRRAGEVGEGAERAFLVGTVRRLAVRAKRRSARDVAVADLEIEDRADGPEALVDRSRERALLDDALAAIPDDVRETFSLFELEGLGKAEVAAYYGIPIGTAATRRARARSLVLGELRRAVVARSSPCVAARARLFRAGRGWYGARGLWPRYVAALPASLAGDLDAASTDREWVPLDTAMALYHASNALGLDEAAELEVGRHIFGCVNGRDVDALVRLRAADPTAAAVAVLEHASLLWSNAFVGGDVRVHKRAERHVELEMRAPMFVYRFFRNCIVGATVEALSRFRDVAIRVEGSARRSLLIAARV